MNSHSNNPLHTALELGQIDVAEELIKNGASILDVRCARHKYPPEAQKIYDREAKKLIEEQKKLKLSLWIKPNDNSPKSFLTLAAEIGDIDSIHYQNRIRKFATQLSNEPSDSTISEYPYYLH